MASFVRHTSRAKGYENALKALDFALKAHDGQTRKKSDVPYIYHPLNMACHVFAMGVDDDAVISACLLHDVVEDTAYTLDDLPVSDETKKLVSLMTHPEDNGKRDEIMRAYFDGLATNPKAALIKCVDRCNNITTMSWGLSRERIYRTIRETETYVLPLLKIVKNTLEYNNAAWLLSYQIESMLDIYKRLM
jgi:GTP pyrophosphokinase